jgi:major membrane immunogen (membrane-anchored lipoprotein)
MGKKGLVVLVVMALLFAGCQSVTGRASYQTHGNPTGTNFTLGYSEVTVNKDGNVTNITLDDYFMPGVWAIISETVPADMDGATTTVDGKVYANKIKIGNSVFDFDSATGAYKGNVLGTDVDDLLAWFARDNNRTQEQNLWYIDACRNGQLAYLKADGNPSGTRPSYTTGGKTTTTMSKNETGYWTIEDGLGWTGNRDAILVYAKSKNGDVTDVDMVAGATASDTKNYLETIRLARQAAQ